MISLKNITKSYTDKPLLDEVSLSLGRSETVGLIGNNGVGKTTLMDIVLGNVVPDAGTIEVGGESIAYLPQHFSFNGKTIAEVLHERMPDEYQAWRIDAALDTVGLDDINRAQPADSLSGGQKTRLGLAAILLADPKPTVLLLDEPSNNLDSEGLKWLGSFLRGFAGGVLLTLHDRSFLDDTVNRIIELDSGKAKNYGGNYSHHREQKQSERQSQIDQYNENEEERKRLSKAITAQRQKASHTQSHIKRSDNDKAQRDYFKNRVTVKFDKQAKALSGRLDQLAKVERPVDRKNYVVSLDGTSVARKLILAASDITKNYGQNQILSNLSFEVYGQDRLWVSGNNGSGKSTLLKILASQLKPDSGVVRLGPSVSVGHYSQDTTGFDMNMTGIDELLATCAKPQDCYQRARSLHLSQADLIRPLSELSRGQLAKLAFTKLLLAQHQLIILDEPTNHLEITTREDIENALSDYRGAVIVASHDQYFLQTIGTTSELTISHN